MAVDKKADYVGNHGGVYSDIDGMSKQFTYIDHDRKTTISAHNGDKVDFAEFFKNYRDDLIRRILELPASICHEWFQDFTVRGEGQTHVTWNEKMLRDQGVPTQRLRDLCVMLENKAELMRLTS